DGHEVDATVRVAVGQSSDGDGAGIRRPGGRRPRREIADPSVGPTECRDDVESGQVAGAAGIGSQECDFAPVRRPTWRKVRVWMRRQPPDISRADEGDIDVVVVIAVAGPLERYLIAIR